MNEPTYVIKDSQKESLGRNVYDREQKGNRKGRPVGRKPRIPRFKITDICNPSNIITKVMR